MADHHLPEDVTRWPTDPYQLLGINAGIDERGLKKAYAKLIRKFKPEHHPTEFARIRAAFEHVQGYLDTLNSWRTRGFETSADDDELMVGDDEHTEESNSAQTAPSRQEETREFPGPEAASEREVPFRELPRPDRPKPARESWEPHQDSLELAWQNVLKGNSEQGYQQLLSLIKNPAASADVYIRLYWVQRLFPKLGTQHPAHWLVASLRRSHLRGPAWELYCYELDRNPDLAAEHSHCSLLVYAGTPERLFDLLEHRWRAVLKSNRWDLIRKDLNHLQSTVQDNSVETWARILFRAVDLAAWSSHSMARDIAGQCERELQELTELHFRLNSEFNRFDHVLAIMAETPVDRIEHEADDLDQVAKLTNEFASLIRDTWTESLYVLTPRIISMLETWVKNPGRALGLLTDLRKRAPLAFRHLCGIIRRLDQDDIDREALARTVAIRSCCHEFLLQRQSMPYFRLREDVLEFCVTNGITPTEMRSVCQFLLETQMVRGTIDALQNDLELEVLVQGIFAFWAAGAT